MNHLVATVPSYHAATVLARGDHLRPHYLVWSDNVTYYTAPVNVGLLRAFLDRGVPGSLFLLSAQQTIPSAVLLNPARVQMMYDDLRCGHYWN
jgi:hypothetical protein